MRRMEALSRQMREMGFLNFTMRILLLLFIAIFAVRCTDTETFIPDPQVETYKGSAFVIIEDPSGTPVEGVKIEMGNRVGYTNEDGLLWVRDAQMSGVTYLKAEKDGYFHGSRRFYPSRGKTHYIRVTLLPLQEVGTFETAAGGSVAVDDYSSLVFAPGSVMREDGSGYTGTVHVKAFPIHANDPAMSDMMPGDLVGVNASGAIGALGSMGMMAVELQTASGEKLQVATGQTVEMRMEISADMAGVAPMTIPMWSFDEQAGVWKEEGEAIREGYTYVAQVGHFSYWNYDAWFPIVKWGASFVFENGAPASQVSVCITILELETTKCALTNEDGVVCGMVAANELLLMTVKDPCGNVIYEQEIGPYSDTTMIGPITLPEVLVDLTEISGSAVNCDDEPVTDGFVKIEVGDRDYYEVLDENDGTFSLTVMNCDQSELTVTALDEAALKQSLPYTFAYAPVIDAGTIEVCETITEYIDLEVEGFPDHYVFFFPNANTQTGITTIYANDSTSQNQFFYVRFNATEPGTYILMDGFEVGMQLPTSDFVYASELTLTITYFGNVGDYIQGTLTGIVTTGTGGGGGTEYNLSGSFSVLRE